MSILTSLINPILRKITTLTLKDGCYPYSPDAPWLNNYTEEQQATIIDQELNSCEAKEMFG